MESKFCPLCKCLILADGFCRNKDCPNGKKDRATVPQVELILKLCNELNVDLKGKNPTYMSKTNASKLINRLIAKKTQQQLFGSEDEE